MQEIKGNLMNCLWLKRGMQRIKKEIMQRKKKKKRNNRVAESKVDETEHHALRLVVMHNKIARTNAHPMMNPIIHPITHPIIHPIIHPIAHPTTHPIIQQSM